MQVDLHGGEQVLQAKAVGRTLHAVVQFSHSCYWGYFRCQPTKLGGSR
jgi:hypothetical protein